MTYLNNIKSILPSWLEKEISVNIKKMETYILQMMETHIPL